MVGILNQIIAFYSSKDHESGVEATHRRVHPVNKIYHVFAFWDKISFIGIIDSGGGLILCPKSRCASNP